MRTIIINVFCALLLSETAMAIPRCADYWDGGQGKLLPKFWDGVAIVYAVTGESKIVDDNEDLPFILTFRNLATVFGEIDPSKEPVIKARAAVGGLTEVMPGPPEPNCRVIVVLRKRKQGGGYEVPPFPMDFMPNGTAIVPVTGDPRPVMEQILKSIRKILGDKKPGIAEKK